MNNILGTMLVLTPLLLVIVPFAVIILLKRAEEKRRAAHLAALPADLQQQAAWMTAAHLEQMHRAQLAPDHQRAVVARRLDVGLPPEAVQVIWGRPHDIDRKGGKGGDVLIWTWWERGDRGRKKIDKRVTFRDGGLEKWEDR